MSLTELNLRAKAPLHLRYIIITREAPFINILPPNEFENLFLKTIQQLPKTFIQLDGRTTELISNDWFANFQHGYDLSIIYERNLEVITSNSNKKQITILFIDQQIPSEPVLNIFRKNCFRFYYFNPNQSDVSNSFSSSFDLVRLFKRDKDDLSKHFLRYGLNVNFDFTSTIPDKFKHVNRFTYFTPSLTNFLMLNQYIGNLWHDESYISELNNITEIEEQKLISESSSQKGRMNILLNQIINIDAFKPILIKAENVQNELGNAIPYYTPLLIVSPFQYPILEQIAPELYRSREYDSVKEAFKAEQDLDYRNSLEIKGRSHKQVVEMLSYINNLVKSRLHYLDSVSYFHASFTYSPTIRLPLKGKSLSRYLSIFDPGKALPTKTKFLKLIKQFGEFYVSTSMSTDVQDNIVKRNRQLVFISDLPVEWFSIRGVPLSFTHDTTRLPEIPYGGLMAAYVKTVMFKYEVPEDVIKKTLVIFGVPTENGHNSHFSRGYGIIESLSKELGFSIAQCSTIVGLKSAIDQNKPDLLIFDTHGKSDSKTKTTSLQIGSQWLSGDDIVKHRISAPLVILSACNTVPNWGYLNPITNAFFETGSISVTGTFLPIGIISGTLFYHRILRNLNYAATDGLHNNWLNFLSHNIRSTYFLEILREINKKILVMFVNQKEQEYLSKKAQKLTAQLLAESMSFSNRRKLFLEIKDRYNTIHPKIKLDLALLPLEQLLYTNLGRSDLIYFKSWLKRSSKDAKNQ